MANKEEQNSAVPKKDKAPNTKSIPAIIILSAAFISCAVSIYQRQDFGTFVYRLLVIVVIFMVLGTVIKMVLDYAFRTIEEPVSIDDMIDAEENSEGAAEDSEENQEASEEQ